MTKKLSGIILNEQIIESLLLYAEQQEILLNIAEAEVNHEITQKQAQEARSALQGENQYELQT